MIINNWIHCGRTCAGVPGAGLVFCCAFLLLARPASVSAQDAGSRDLRLFYQENCAGCHGADGAGQGPDGKKLSGQDFTDVKWRQDTRDDRMVKIILGGKFFGLAMPAYKGKLTGEEARRIVTEILRTAAKGEGIEPAKK